MAKVIDKGSMVSEVTYRVNIGPSRVVFATLYYKNCEFSGATYESTEDEDPTPEEIEQINEAIQDYEKHIDCFSSCYFRVE